MPSVTINEIDNTIVQQTPSTFNTTLIFGASTYGPSNTPTLLSTLNDLSIFGSAVKNTYSYETAKNILRLGYPVLFTRITNKEKVDESGVPLNGYAYTPLYGHKDMKDGSLVDYTILDNVDYGYKVDSSFGEATNVEVTVDSETKAITVVATYSIVPSGTDTYTSVLLNNQSTTPDTPVVVLSSPTIDADSKTLTWTIPSGTSGYDAPGLVTDNKIKNFSLSSTSSDGTDTTNLVKVAFGATEEEAAVTVKAKYTGSYGNNININLYRVALAKLKEEDPTNYQYNLKVYVGNSLVETFKVMQYPGKGYGDGETPLDETFDRALGAALKDAVVGSNYIIIDNIVDQGKTSDFHKPDNLKAMDQTVDGKYIVNMINLSSINPADAESNYDDATSVQEALFGISHEYIENSVETNIFKALEDKYTYDFRFVTTAGFCKLKESSEEILKESYLYDAIKKLCYTRGDAFGVLDIDKDVELTASELNDYLPVKQYESVDDSYVGYYCPWCYGTGVDGNAKWLPPSYWFLQAMFTNVNNGGQVYNPPAGVKRMRLPSITATSAQIGGVTLDELQSDESNHIRINPIMSLRNYGYVVYGLRTAYTLSPPYELAKKSALQQPHVRIIANEIKSVIFDTALGLTFDNNNLITWNAFVSKVNATLSSMQTNNALNDYEIIMDESLQREDRKVIYGSVKVSVFEAVEDFVIDFQLDPSTVTYGESTVEL